MTRDPITTSPAHIIVASREIVPLNRLQEYFDRAFTRAFEAVQSAGAQPAGPPRAYYFSPLTDVVDLAAGFPVAEEHAAAVEAAFPDLVHRIPESRVRLPATAAPTTSWAPPGRSTPKTSGSWGSRPVRCSGRSTSPCPPRRPTRPT